MKVGVLGANGRMGHALVRAVSESPSLELMGVIDGPSSTREGADAGESIGLGTLGVKVTKQLSTVIGNLDVLIDFSSPAATVAAAQLCAEHGVKMVIGTTGFSAEQEQAVQEVAKTIAMVKATNMSVGVNLTFKLAQMAAKALGDTVDVEIVEAHHRHKVDSPSGTALTLGQGIARELGRDLDDVALYGREGQMGARDRQTIGFSTIRGGDVVGEHTAMFIGDGERIEITHRSNSRDNYANGSVRACEWLEGKLCGCFDMIDVLDLNN